MFFDLFDGKVARWRNEASMLGQELDSLADSVRLFATSGTCLFFHPQQISFGVAPAFVAWVIGMRTGIDTFLLTGFVCCGIARLARFNATVASVPKDATGKSKYFEGLPIPTSLILVGIMAECVRRGEFEAQGPRAPGKGLPWGLVRPLQEHAGLEVHWMAILFAWCARALPIRLGRAQTRSQLGGGDDFQEYAHLEALKPGGCALCTFFSRSCTTHGPIDRAPTLRFLTLA